MSPNLPSTPAARGQIADPLEVGRDSYFQVRRLAVQNGRAVAEMLMLYKLERTLNRLALTRFRDRFVLKGGLLLAAYKGRRPTKDIDGMIRDLTLDEEAVREVCRAVAYVDAGDGLSYDLETLTVREIREDAEYVGFRATMICMLHTDRQKVSFDFSTGDPIAPPPAEVVIPGLLGEDVAVLGYPAVMVVAEKFVTALVRGATSTRWRDLVDMRTISYLLSFDAIELRASLDLVAGHRGAVLRPLQEALGPDYGKTGQAKYAAWRRKNGLEDVAPEEFAEALEAVCAFVDPVVGDDRTVPGARWDPVALRWA